MVDWSWRVRSAGGGGGVHDARVGAHLVVFAILFEELFAKGVFDGRRLVGFAEDAEVGLVGAGGAEGEGCAGVGADALGAAHCECGETRVVVWVEERGGRVFGPGTGALRWRWREVSKVVRSEA